MKRKLLKTLEAEDELAIPAGLEPATRGVEIRYSIQLSYGTVGANLSHLLHSTHNIKNLLFGDPARTIFWLLATKQGGAGHHSSPDRFVWAAARSQRCLKVPAAPCRTRLYAIVVQPPSARHHYA